ncbi:PREDICTED: lymphocyte-specific protein 1 isoform X1 [Myotis davidii]|uniref:lymphocyte-specific protein 1 isoform X1 n=1 Tax=Myotis davidii TaxID=225400 RepID=UPI000766E4D7|nr:PREDICTED: lymphocyte-specific protein 1 isoform X1 [Myotis davidii]XP_015420947.1 PREDICTED: lymphocyte-specific protein 1 isoform X1 [Myotis davidii]XP_015420948.1 PREDICTED: lymphocyte-specific protein 1 isoform X1 [Myotis davidii]
MWRHPAEGLAASCTWGSRAPWEGRGRTDKWSGARLASQWSLEDEEEAARERRRRERDRHQRAQDQDGGSPSPEPPEQEKLLKASEAPELEEDEGFGDWAQKPELRQPLQGESPEGEQEARPCGHQDGDELRPARVSLEELHLHPDSEPQDEPGPEQAEPMGPEETGRGSPGPAEAEEHQQRQRPRAPSPLLLEETTEPSSPPLSPSTKLIDRTESLSRSIKKSNSVKRSEPALPISKIDDRLEQYTQAIETAGRNSKLARQPSIELPSMAVASTKSRWETGEVQAQSAAKSPSCKDIVAGDMSKKSLWEQKGGSKTSSTIKSTPSGKRYKFVATGHGKYEKVLMDEGSAP